MLHPLQELRPAARCAVAEGRGAPCMHQRCMTSSCSCTMGGGQRQAQRPKELLPIPACMLLEEHHCLLTTAACFGRCATCACCRKAAVLTVCLAHRLQRCARADRCDPHRVQLRPTGASAWSPHTLQTHLQPAHCLHEAGYPFMGRLEAMHWHPVSTGDPNE